MGKTCLPEGGAGNFWCRPFFWLMSSRHVLKSGKVWRAAVLLALGHVTSGELDPALPINSVHYRRRGPMPGCRIGRPEWPKSWGRHKFKAFINHSDFCLAIGTDIQFPHDGKMAFGSGRAYPRAIPGRKAASGGNLRHDQQRILSASTRSVFTDHLGRTRNHNT